MRAAWGYARAMRWLGGLALLGALCAAPAWACTCLQTAAEDALQRDDLSVFAGRATHYVKSPLGAFALIEVKKSWARRMPSHVIMPVEITTCGHPDVWTTPSDWLFVTSRAGPGVVSTTMCLGNLRMVDAAPTILRLGPTVEPWSVVPLVGVVLVLLAVVAVLMVQRLRRKR